MQVAVVLVKSWQRLNNAQYVLKEHPELFSSFAAAYRRQCEPRARQPDPFRSLSPCPAPRQHDAPHHAPTTRSPTTRPTTRGGATTPRAQMASAWRCQTRATTTGTSRATFATRSGAHLPRPSCSRALRKTCWTTRPRSTTPSRASTRASCTTPRRCARTRCRPHPTSRPRTSSCLATWRWTLSTGDWRARCARRYLSIAQCCMLHRSPTFEDIPCVPPRQTYVFESATQCAVVLKLLESGQLRTKWDFFEDYNTLCAAVEGMPPPPGLDASFARVVVLCAPARIACTAHVLRVPHVCLDNHIPAHAQARARRHALRHRLRLLHLHAG